MPDWETTNVLFSREHVVYNRLCVILYPSAMNPSDEETTTLGLGHTTYLFDYENGMQTIT